MIAGVVAGTLILLVAGIIAVSRSAADEVAFYGPFHIGMDMSEAMIAASKPRFDLVGTLEIIDESRVWTLHDVQGPPLVHKLEADDLENNQFLNHGWAYPEERPEGPIIVVRDMQSRNLDQVYLFFNEDGLLHRIFVGSS